MKINNYHIIILISVFAFVVSSCGDSLGYEDNIKVEYGETEELLPLTIGNYWNYDIVHYDSYGNINKRDTVKIEVLDMTLFNDTNWYYFSNCSEILPELAESAMFKNSDSGLVVTSIMDRVIDELLFQYPAEINSEIKISYPDDEGKYIERELSSLNEIVKINSTEYKCCKYWDTLYNYDGTAEYNPMNVYYFKPGTGLVKTVRYEVSPYGELFVHRKMALIDYELK